MLELAPIENNGPKKHEFLKRSGTRTRKNINQKLEKLPQNNGLIGFNKGMTYADTKKGTKPKVNLSKKSFKVPPGGHSSLDLFSQTTTNIPDPRELRKQYQLRPLSQEQPQKVSPSHSNYSNKNQQRSLNYENGNGSHQQQQSNYSNGNYQQQQSNYSNGNYQQQQSNYPSGPRQQQQQHQQYPSNNPSHGNYQQSSRSNIFQQESDAPLFGARNGSNSSNAYACGSNQNCGNVITERSSTRLHAPPGGMSSFSLAHEENVPTARQSNGRDFPRRNESYSEQVQPTSQARKGYDHVRKNEYSQEYGQRGERGNGGGGGGGGAGVGSIALLLKKGNSLISEFGDHVQSGSKSRSQPSDVRSIAKNSQNNSGKSGYSSRERASQAIHHNPVKVPGLENHYSEQQRKQFGV